MTSPVDEKMPSLLETLAAQLRGHLLVRGDDATKDKFDNQRNRSWVSYIAPVRLASSFASSLGIQAS